MAGILESVPTIISTAVVAYEIVETIVELAQDAKKIGKQMRADALPFRAFGDLIETAQYSIKFRLPQDSLAVISYMRDRQVLENMEQEAVDLNKDIKEQKDKIRRLQSNFGDQANYALRYYAAHRWKNTRKPKLELLLPRMEQLKSTLQLIIAVIQLEVLSRNGGASRGGSRLNEIEELRKVIGKHIEAIGKLGKNFSEQAKMNGEGGSATGICYLAYTMARTGRVPRTGLPARFDFTQLTKRPILNVDSRHWVPPPSELPAGAPICPHCYRNTGTTDGNTTNGNTSNRNPSNHISSSRNTSYGSSKQAERDLAPLPPQSPQTQQPPAFPPQQDVQVVIPVSDETSSIYGDHEPRHAVTQPQPPAHQPEPEPEPISMPGPQPSPLPEFHTLPVFQPDPIPQQDEFPEPPPLEPLPGNELNNGVYNQYGQYLGGQVGGELYRPRSRSPRPRQPTTVEEVLVQQGNSIWVKQRVRFDPNLEIRNRHGVRGAEVPYGGLISESYLESLMLRGTAEWFNSEFSFPYDDEHRDVRGIGTVDTEWKKQPGLDDWEDLVVDKPKVKCIICREMPCEENVVLKP